jgi:hypothetical protein
MDATRHNAELSPRNEIARFIAGLIALGGTPYAILLGLMTLAAGPMAPWVFLVFSPGWFAWFAMIWAALGRRLPGDPVTTWLPGVLVNGFWCCVMLPDLAARDTSGAATFPLLTSIYVVVATAAGIVGMMIEILAVRHRVRG